MCRLQGKELITVLWLFYVLALVCAPLNHDDLQNQILICSQDATDALNIAYSSLLTRDLMIYNTVPPGHLWSSPRGDAGRMGPSKSSFPPTFL